MPIGNTEQIERRLSGAVIEPNYSDEEIAELIKPVGTFALFAFQQIAIAASRLDLATEAVGRLEGVDRHIAGAAESKAPEAGTK